MILRVLALFCLLQVALTRHYNACGEKEFYNRLILACDQCSECPKDSYIERACTPYEDTQCIECGVVDHENDDFKLKCGVQVDQDFKDAIEVQIRGQLEKTFALKEKETDSEVERLLKKINDEWAEPEIISNGDVDDDDDEEDEESEADVVFTFVNLETEDDSDEPIGLKIGRGALPEWARDSDETDEFRPNLDYKQNERKVLKKGKRVEPKEIEDESDYEEEKPLKIAKESEEDELKLIELEENDRRLVSFEEVDEERDPFPELLPQKIRKRPVPAVRLLDPLFDLDEEEENLKKVDDDFDSDSDSDENTPVIKEMIFERIKPQVVDFQTWKQQRRGGVKNIKLDGDDDEDSDSDSDESFEKEMTLVKSEHVSFRKRFFRAMTFTSFFMLVLILLVWIAKLRRRNRIYRYHLSKLRYLTPEEREVIERAAGFIQKPAANIYENHVYESA